MLLLHRAGRPGYSLNSPKFQRAGDREEVGVCIPTDGWLSSMLWEKPKKNKCFKWKRGLQLVFCKGKKSKHKGHV